MDTNATPANESTRTAIGRSVFSRDEHRRTTEISFGGVRERTGAKVAAQHPVAALVEASRDADMLVVGSRGLHGLKALGSVSERIARDASCTVLFARIAPPSQERSC